MWVVVLVIVFLSFPISVFWALRATVHSSAVINNVSHPAHLEDDGNAAFQPVTPDLELTSQTHFFSL